MSTLVDDRNQLSRTARVLERRIRETQKRSTRRRSPAVESLRRVLVEVKAELEYLETGDLPLPQAPSMDELLPGLGQAPATVDG